MSLFTAHLTALTMQPVLSDVYLGSLSLEETAEIQATHCEVTKLTCFNDQLFFCFIGFDRNLSLMRCCFTFSFALCGGPGVGRLYDEPVLEKICSTLPESAKVPDSVYVVACVADVERGRG